MAKAARGGTPPSCTSPVPGTNTARAHSAVGKPLPLGHPLQSPSPDNKNTTKRWETKQGSPTKNLPLVLVGVQGASPSASFHTRTPELFSPSGCKGRGRLFCPSTGARLCYAGGIRKGRGHPHLTSVSLHAQRQACFTRVLVQRGDGMHNRRKQAYRVSSPEGACLLCKNMKRALFTHFQFTKTLKVHRSCLHNAVNIKLRAY